MNAELEIAFSGVYFSSREIVRKNQHHLFCNMLDLLASTCKATGGQLVSSLSKDDQIDFWCNDILPLIFDKDVAVQCGALKALEVGLLQVPVSVVHSSAHWPMIRTAFINDYRPRVHELREQRNANWHQVWGILVRLLDVDVLKNANTINSFLSIVELGFRCSENRIRIEAFNCWRQLIALFVSHNEIHSAKRLKLIIIPLKSSQAKVAEAAVTKFRVWWYLLTCLGSRAVEFFDPVLEHFLTFCFGSQMRNVRGATQQYEEVRALALPCWTKLLTATGKTSHDLLQRTLLEHGLESFAQPSPLADFGSLSCHRQSVVDATLQAVRLLVDRDDGENAASEAEQYMLELLLRYLMQPLIYLDDPSYSAQICRELIQFLPQRPRPVIFALNCIATEGLQWKNGDGNDGASRSADDYADVLESLMQLLVAGRAAAMPRAVLQRCVGRVFSLSAFGSGRNQWRALVIVLDMLTEHMLITGDENSSADVYELRFLVWEHMSCELLDYLAENGLDCRVKENAAVLHRWTLWPLAIYATHARPAIGATFNDEFCALWRRLLNAGRNTPECERGLFFDKVMQQMQLLLPLGVDENRYFGELLNVYAAEVLRVKAEWRTKLVFHRQLLMLIKSVIDADTPPKAMEVYLGVLRMVVTELKDDDLLALIENVRSLFTHVLQCMKKKTLSKGFFTSWKQVMQERLRAHSNKTISSQAIELFKNDDVFVIIPSVWTLNPDKLTDHQKEHFRKKTNDIPALYNDLSHSQESSSIKPWSPKQIVVPKEIESPVVIDKQEQQEDEDKTTIEAGNTPTTSATKRNKANKKHSVRKSARCQSKIITANSKADLKPPSPQPLPAGSEIENTAKENVPINVELTTNVESVAKKGSTLTEMLVDSVFAPEMVAPKATDVANESTVATTNEKSKEQNVSDKMGVGGESQLPLDEAVKSLENESQLHGVNELPKVEKEQTPLHEYMEQKIMSPKRNNPKYTLLSSPPDRKLTNNSTSPTLRSKSTSHLTGRGAQLINMIRNKKVDLPSHACSSPSRMHTSMPKPSFTSIFAKAEKQVDANNINNHNNSFAGEQMNDAAAMEPEHTSTPMQCRDLLVFSRTLPAIGASPSSSILKRKMHCESFDELNADSPMNKRKRVSFHDPPVSITKEYLLDSEENKSKRCLNMDKVAISETRHALKRQNKLHSIAQIENFAVLEKAAKLEDLQCALESDPIENAAKEAFEDTCNEQEPTAQPAAVAPIDLSQVDPETLLSFVVENHPMEALLDKYFNTDSTSTPYMCNGLAKYLSSYMTAQPKVTMNVLEVLSENHSKEFLDHAIQENLSSVVCDRLNLNSVIDFICAKSKINTNCRNNLLAQLPEVFKQCKSQSERMECIEQLLQCTPLKDTDMLQLITLLVKIRTENPNSSMDTGTCESAVDSSSNL